MPPIAAFLFVLATGCFVSPERLDELRGDEVVDADHDGLAADVDCDDDDPDVGDSITVYADLDGDGFGTEEGTLATGCTTADGQAASGGDCDDDDAERFPGHAEVADDGIDQDCTGADTVTCFTDGDHDGWGSTTVVLAADGVCDASAGEAVNDDDCADGDDTRFPGATETPGDTIDQNCDGADTPACYHDDDLDGFGDPLDPIVTEDCAGQSGVTVGTDCADGDGTVHPGAAELCDGQANTCGTLPADETDPDADGYVACALDAGGWDGAAGVVGGGDCDGSNGATHPGASEICDGRVNLCGSSLPANEIDGDDDGYVACTFASGVTSATWGNAETPAVVGGADCDASNAATYPGASEICDGKVNLCGGSLPANEIDSDDDGYVACTFASGVTSANWGNAESPAVVGSGDCDGANSATHPGASEICDGKVNICGGSLPANEIDGDDDGYVACTFASGVNAGNWGNAETPTVVGGGDCDAASGAIHPGAAEICDGKVNLCGGALPANEIDGDDDGYVACTFASGVNAGNWGNAETPAVVGGGDCDAASGATHPGASEICDGKVNLCGGSLPANEIDGDDDGYVACTFASGVTSGNWGHAETPAVIGSGDCDATSGDTYPGATEICDDGADGDCDGTADASDTCIPIEARAVAPLSTATVTTRQPTLHWAPNEVADGATVQICTDRACTDVEVESDVVGTSLTLESDLATGVHYWRLFGRRGDSAAAEPGPTWEFFVPARSTPRDTSHGSVPDFNGDGYADLVVGARGYPSGAGNAYVYYGGPDGLSDTADLVLDPPAGGAGEFGGPPGNAGDVDGDGYGDLIVGAPAAAGGGRAFVYFGSPSGLPATPDLTLTCPATSPTRCGEGANGVGDVNGDGFADLAIGAGGDTEVYVFFGRAGGPSTTPGATLTGISGTSAIYYRIWSGDLDGDDLSDILVTAPLYNNQQGRVYVFNGSATAMSSSPSSTIENHLGAGTLCSAAGGWCAVGDWDGDGRLDLAAAITLQTGTGGGAHLYYGAPGGLPDDPDQTLATPPDDGGISCCFASNTYDAGDVDGDGYSDLLVADFIFDDFTQRTGRAWLYKGGASGASASPSAVFKGREDDDRYLGFSGGGADFDGDGFSDVAVANQGDNTDGRVDIYRGAEEGPAAPPEVQLKLAPAVTNSWFGNWMAL